MDTSKLTKKLPQTVITTEKGNILQPVNGEVITASEIPDPMFSTEMLGPSVGIKPTDNEIYAPFDGIVKMIFPTNHAIGLESNNGVEVMIHVGIDTVDMNGNGFESHVQEGDQFKQGDLLLTFDSKKIKEAGNSDCVIVVLTNGSSLNEVKKLK